MPIFVDNPPAHVRPQEKSEKTSLATDHVGQLGTNATFRIDGVHERPNGELWAKSFAVDVQRNLGAQPSRLLNQPSSLSPEQLGQVFSAKAPAPMQFEIANNFDQAMRDLGIEWMNVVVDLNQDKPVGSLVVNGEVFTHSVAVNGDDMSYTLEGAPLGEFIQFLTNGRHNFSSVTIHSNGEQVVLTPSTRIETPIPGVTAATFSASASQTSSSAVGGMHGIGQGFFSTQVAGDPAPVVGGQSEGSPPFSVINQHSFAARFDFGHSDRQGSVLIASGPDGENRTRSVVAVGGDYFFDNGMVAQGGASYQWSEQSRTVGGQIILSRLDGDFHSNPNQGRVFQLRLDGRIHQEGQGDPSGEAGFMFELRR